MDFGSVQGLVSMVLGYAIPFLFVLTVVVFFHELGHFLVARWCGVRVESFSVGFGRELMGFTDKRGTRWKVGWLPLGGYVKFYGDEGVASTPNRSDEQAMHAPDSFHAKSVGQRAAIVAAGPVANFILAIAIFAVMFSTFGRTVMTPYVNDVEPGSAAAEAGFEPGDLVIAIDGRSIESFSDLQRIVSMSAGIPLDFELGRDGSTVRVTATPRLQELEGPFGMSNEVGVLGVRRAAGTEGVEVRRYDPVSAVWQGVIQTGVVIDTTLSYVGRVVTGQQSADQLGGPIRIAHISGQAATLGMVALINLAALLSVSIGLINLFPIPMLDGGHLVYYAVEAVRGRPLSESVQDIGFRIGLGLVLMLMLFATWNDLVQLHVF